MLVELYENWSGITILLRVPSRSGMVDSLAFVLRGDPSVLFRLYALAIVFRARKWFLKYFLEDVLMTREGMGL